MIFEGFKGWLWKSSGNNTIRQGNTNEAMVSDAMPRYYDATVQGNTFYAANQAATAYSVALNTTYTGLVVSNPAGSNKNLVLLKVGLALSVAPAGIASIGLFGGFLAGGITIHTTPLIPASNIIGGGSNPTAKADSAATLVGTPVWIQQLMGGFTAAALPSSPMVVVDLEGSVIIPQGGYVGIGALTAVTGLGFMSWIEVPAF